MTEGLQTSVLIVGAGPVGLGLAIDLGWRGIDCLVVDQGDGTITLPRAATMTARTMEFYRRWGIAGQVASAGFPQDYRLDIVYCTSLSGHFLEREAFPALRDRTPPPVSPVERGRCPQKFLNPVLARAAVSRPGVSIRYRSKLEAFEEDGEGVLASVRRLDEAEAYDFSGDNVVDDEVRHGVSRSGKEASMLQVRARYMVACDGVESGVRRALGIGLDGTAVIRNGYTVSLAVRSARLQDQHPMGEAERYMFIGPEGVWGNLTTVDGSDEWRLSLTGFDQRIDLGALNKEAVVRRSLGSDRIPFSIDGVSTWRRREIVAERMRAGRVFLAGDAVHSMSPTGGFGMNTGLGDAVDLGWKLAAVLKGWAPELLLETYESERKPVGHRFVQAGTALFKPWLLDLDYSRVLDATPEGEACRRHIGATLKREMYPEWQTWGTAMGYRYEDSPICVPDGSAAPPDDPVEYIQTARPGSRAPHVWLGDDRSTLDLFGHGFVLLRLGPRPPDAGALLGAAQRSGVPLTVFDIADESAHAAYEARLALVRPDGHVAWRGDALPKDAARLIDTVRGAHVR